eukprot:GDKI01015629.1.p1 GENE.GDKI01015629.1~~GDKI01015629.1.p1  ORF type:complete len:205 (+),score=56.88 GDKI01015629.1:104-718(+)
MAPKRKRAASPAPKESKEGTAAETSGSADSGTLSAPRRPQYFLMKSEPESRMQDGVDMKFGLDDLKAMPQQTEHWDGVRNYQARNIMRQMRVGDLAFFYHSNCKTPGVVGVVRIVREAYTDHTQFDKKDPHYDPKSTESEPKWQMVDVKFERDLPRPVTLQELKGYKDRELKTMALLHRGRLSVQCVAEEEWNFILKLAEQPPA